MKTGRPKKEINKQTFESLCQIQCTQEEICCVLDVDDVTLNSWCKRTYKQSFSEVFRQKKKKGVASLRRRGFQMAGEIPSVHIFYMKNHGGMSDNPMPSNDQSKALADAVEKLEIVE